MGSKSGGGGGTNTVTSNPSPETEATTKFFRESVATPTLSALVPQVVEALNTGGIGAKIPMVQRGVEQSRSATSNALSQTGQSLAQSGLEGSPFGEMVLSQQRQQGEQATAAIPTDIAGQLAGLASSLGTGGGQIAASGGGGSSTGKSTTEVASQLGPILGGSAASLGSAYIIGKALKSASSAAACWAIAALYGYGTPKFLEMRTRMLGSSLCNLYLRYGPRLALIIHRHPRLKPILRLAIERIV